MGIVAISEVMLIEGVEMRGLAVVIAVAEELKKTVVAVVAYIHTV